MNKTFLHLEIVLLLAVPTAAVAQDSISEKSITGNVMTEVNFGHRYGQEKPTVIDFPHIVAGATWQMGRLVGCGGGGIRALLFRRQLG